MREMNDNNFYLSENEVINLVSVLGAAAAGFKNLAKNHEHPEGITAAWLLNYVTAADELRETITQQSNENIKRREAEMHHTAGYHTNPNMSYLYRPK